MKWLIYIPEEGHWDFPQKKGSTKKEARKAYLLWARRKRLPKGSNLIQI